MIPSLAQAAQPASNGNVDFLNASIASDGIAAIFLSSSATANDAVTPTPTAKLFLGVTDYTRNYGMGLAIADGATGANAQMVDRDDAAIVDMVSNGTIDGKAVFGSAQPTGVRMAFSPTSGRLGLVNALQFSGTGLAVKCATQAYLNADTVKTITHNDSAAPDLFLVFATNGAVLNSGGSLTTFVGAFERNGSTTESVSFRQTTTSNPTSISEKTAANAGDVLAAGSSLSTVTIGNVTATTVDVTRNTGFVGSTQLFIISFRGTSTALTAKCVLAQTPLVTGVVTPLTGMAAKPQFAIFIGTRMTAAGSVVSDDSAGCLSIGFAVDNAGTTQYCACAMTSKQGVATSVSKSVTTQGASLLGLTNTGAVAYKAFPSSWNTDGLSLNFTTVDASNADEYIIIAAGIAAAASGIPLKTESPLAGLSGGFRLQE